MVYPYPSAADDRRPEASLAVIPKGWDQSYGNDESLQGNLGAARKKRTGAIQKSQNKQKLLPKDKKETIFI